MGGGVGRRKPDMTDTKRKGTLNWILWTLHQMHIVVKKKKKVPITLEYIVF